MPTSAGSRVFSLGFRRGVAPDEAGPGKLVRAEELVRITDAVERHVKHPGNGWVHCSQGVRKV